MKPLREEEIGKCNIEELKQIIETIKELKKDALTAYGEKAFPFTRLILLITCYVHEIAELEKRIKKLKGE